MRHQTFFIWYAVLQIIGVISSIVLIGRDRGRYTVGYAVLSLLSSLVCVYGLYWLLTT